MSQSSITTYPRLLGDVGGTNARFAWQSEPGAPIESVCTYPCKDHESLLKALQHYLREQQKPQPQTCCIGIATPLVGDEVKMTNHHWSFSISALERALGVSRLLVINDFTALALSLPSLPADELFQVGGGQPDAKAPVALLGAGTGLGVSGLLPVPRAGGLVPITGEGGHVTLSPTDERQEAVVRELRRRFGHPSAERALSGPGLVNLYQALCALDGVPARVDTGAAVTDAAVSGADPQCVEAVAIFFSLLGTVAGNLALSLGARGGVYIGGGIVPKLGDGITRSGFRAAFEQKGRYQGYMAAIPVFVITAKQSPALLGASRALDEL
ncbi:MAG: glucokinase [Rhizobacter sp.]